MKRISKRNILEMVITVCSLISIFACQSSFAEGHHGFQNAQGVNRSIRTQSEGYYQVDGNATMTIDYLPKDGGIYQDKPSFYLGGHVSGHTGETSEDVEVDAGIQYEIARGNIPAGWSAFINVSKNGDPPQTCNPSVLNSEGHPDSWRGGVGNTFGTGMNLVFLRDSSGHITTGITITALSSNLCPNSPPNPVKCFFFNPGQVANCEHPYAPYNGYTLTTGNLYDADVKRVVAMTRKKGANSKIDGSQLKCTWSNCHVSRTYIKDGTQHFENGSWVYNPDAEGHLIPYMVDQSITGYDAPGNGSPGAKDSRGEDKIAFPKLNVSSQVARTYSSPSHRATQNGVSRYTTETVDINLVYKYTVGDGYYEIHK